MRRSLSLFTPVQEFTRCLILGGTGEMGSAIAGRLAKETSLQLTVCGRTPPTDFWELYSKYHVGSTRSSVDSDTLANEQDCSSVHLVNVSDDLALQAKIATADLVLISVRPGELDSLSASLRASDASLADSLVMSCLARTSIGSLVSALGLPRSGAHVGRFMLPLTTAHGLGPVAHYYGSGVNDRERAALHAVWQALGTPCPCETEKDIDVLTATASAHGIFCEVALAHTQMLINNGIEPTLAEQMTREMMRAVGFSTSQTPRSHADEARHQLENVKGTTAAAIATMQALGASDALVKSFQAAVDAADSFSQTAGISPGLGSP